MTTPAAAQIWLEIAHYTGRPVEERLDAALRAQTLTEDALKEWQSLCVWGATPEFIDAFIRGQQSRIHAVQGIEKELATIREIFPEILSALGTGAACLPGVSIEFLRAIPNEVHRTAHELKQQLATERAARLSAEADLKQIAVLVNRGGTGSR